MISIIVPVHNTEKYLKACIDSIIIQTYSDFELLLIDDGSSDRSGTICDEYMTSDSRVRVFHTANKGVSSARNTGLDNARGEWIIFADADDVWMERNALESLHNYAIKYKLDITRGEYVSINDSGRQLYPDTHNNKRLASGIIPVMDFINHAVIDEFFLVLCLFNKKIFNDVRFDTDMIFLEDMKVFMQLLAKNPACGYLPLTFYAYRRLNTSVSARPDETKLSNAFSMCNLYWDLADKSDSKDFKDYCRHRAVMMYYRTLQTLADPAYHYDSDRLIRTLNLRDLSVMIRKRRRYVAHLNIKSLLVTSLSPKLGIKLLKVGAWCTNTLKKWSTRQ